VIITPFHQIDSDLWNRFVDESPEAWLFIARNGWKWRRLRDIRMSLSWFFLITEAPLASSVVYLLGSWFLQNLSDRYLHTGLSRSGPATSAGLS